MELELSSNWLWGRHSTNCVPQDNVLLVILLLRSQLKSILFFIACEADSRVYVKVTIHIYISIAIGLLWEHCIILTLEMCPCAIRLRYHLTPDRSWYKLEEFHRRSSHCVTMYCMCKLWSVCLLWETRGTRQVKQVV